jgi:hypothetical protein
MGCCGLCRPKMKSINKNNKNITATKINTIDMWIENIEGPYESIVLPSKSTDKPKIMTNKEEIIEGKPNQNRSNISLSSEINHSNRVASNRKMKNGMQNLQYLSSELSLNEETLLSMSESNPRSLNSFR